MLFSVATPPVSLGPCSGAGPSLATMLDPSLIVWTLVLVVVGLIVAHWAGLEPFVKLGLKQRRYDQFGRFYIISRGF